MHISHDNKLMRSYITIPPREGLPDGEITWRFAKFEIFKFYDLPSNFPTMDIKIEPFHTTLYFNVFRIIMHADLRFPRCEFANIIMKAIIHIFLHNRKSSHGILRLRLLRFFNSDVSRCSVSSKQIETREKNWIFHFEQMRSFIALCVYGRWKVLSFNIENHKLKIELLFM